MGQSKEAFMQTREDEAREDTRRESFENIGSKPMALRLPLPSDLKGLSITKGTITQLAQIIIQGAQEKGVPAYVLKAYAKYLEAIAKDISDRVGDEATDELAQYEGKTVGIAGLTLKSKASAGRFEFDHIPAWVEAKEKIKDIEDTAKKAYGLAIKKKIGTGPQVVSEDGEVLVPAKFTPGKTITEVTIAK